MEDTRITGSKISAIWEQQDAVPAEAMLRKRIEWSRQLLNGELQPPIPKQILDVQPDIDAIRVSSPQKFTGPLKLLNRLIEKWPQLIRYRTQRHPKAEEVATQIERIGKASLELLWPLDVVADRLLNDGQVVVLTYPEMAGWEYSELPKLYEQTKDGEDKEDESGGKVIKSRYQIDSKGRAESDKWYTESDKPRKFKADPKKSADFFEEESKAYFADHVPLCMRSLSRLSYIALNPRREGRYMIMDGLVERSDFRKSDLYRKRYRWGEDREWTPTDRDSGGDTTLFGFWGVDPSNDHVYVSYSVDGKRTWKVNGAGQVEDAVIDLTKEYGITQLSDVVTLEYGWGYPGAIDPAKRAIPYAAIFGRAWQNIDALLTSLIFRHWNLSFAGKLYKPDARLITDLGETGMPGSVDITPMQVNPVLGDLIDIVNTGAGPDVQVVLSILSQQLDKTEVSTTSLTGGGNASGFARNVAEEDAFGTMTQIRRGVLLCAEQCAANALKQMSLIGKKRRPVVLPINQSIIDPSSGQTTTVRSVVEVDPELADGVYNYHAEYPIDPGDNMPLTQQIADLVDRHRLPRSWIYTKGLGVQDPDNLMAEADADAIIDEPAVKLLMAVRALKEIGDEEKLAIVQAMADKAIMELMPGEFAPTSSAAVSGEHLPNHLPGLGVENPAQQTLAGVIGGAMQPGGGAGTGGM